MSLLFKGKPSISLLASALNLFPDSAHVLAPQVIKAIQSSQTNRFDSNPIDSIIYACSHINMTSSTSILPHLAAFINIRSSPEIVSRYLISVARIRPVSVESEYLRELLSNIDLNRLDKHAARLLFDACVALGIAERFDVARFCRRMVASYQNISPTHLARFVWQSARIKSVSYEDISPLLQLMRTSKVNLSARDLRLAVSSIKALVNGRYWYRCMYERALQSLFDDDVRQWEVIAVITAAVRAQAYDDSTLSSLSPFLLKQLPYLKANERLQLVWAFAAASQYDSQIFTETANLDADDIKSFPPGNVSVLIWSFTKVAHFAHADYLYQEVLDYSESRSQDFTLKELSTVILSLATYSLITDSAHMSSRVAKLWQLAVNHIFSNASTMTLDDAQHQVLSMLDQARLALIHNGCVLDHDMAERVATAAPSQTASIKKSLMRDLIIESLRQLDLGEDIKVDVMCERSGIAVPLAFSNVAIECLLRNDFIDELQCQPNGGNKLRCQLLERNGWKVVIISEQDLFYCKVAFDRFRLLVDKLNL